MSLYKVLWAPSGTCCLWLCSLTCEMYSTLEWCCSIHRDEGLIFGEDNGTPVQYSCLENPMDGGAWWAAVHGVAEGRTRLSDFTFTHWRRKWQPSPVFLPGESQGRGAWSAAVSGVAQSQTWLKRLSSSSSSSSISITYTFIELGQKAVIFSSPLLN